MMLHINSVAWPTCENTSFGLRMILSKNFVSTTSYLLWPSTSNYSARNNFQLGHSQIPPPPPKPQNPDRILAFTFLMYKKGLCKFVDNTKKKTNKVVPTQTNEPSDLDVNWLTRMRPQKSRWEGLHLICTGGIVVYQKHRVYLGLTNPS